MSAKHVEKLEIQVHELNVRIEELNRTIVDITSIKTRISQVHNITVSYFPDSEKKLCLFFFF